MRRLFATFALLLMATVVHAQVNALPPTRHILVYGDAQARAVPDRFKIDVNFSAIDVDAGAARQRVEDGLASVVAKLRKSGLEDGDIVATALSIAPETRYDDKTRSQMFVGTRVRRSLTATFDRKEALESFLSGLRTSQELSVSDVRTELSSEAKMRAALRAGAIASTKEKADTIAKAYGAKIASIYSVSDVAPQFDYGVNEGDWPALYEWNREREQLDRVEVTGSRVASPNSRMSLQAGYVTYTDRIYAVFLLAD
ncbi:SIMPL domain-containing protein [Lysobacter sp. PAGU 2638]